MDKQKSPRIKREHLDYDSLPECFGHQSNRAKECSLCWVEFDCVAQGGI